MKDKKVIGVLAYSRMHYTTWYIHESFDYLSNKNLNPDKVILRPITTLVDALGIKFDDIIKLSGYYENPQMIEIAEYLDSRGDLA